MAIHVVSACSSGSSRPTPTYMGGIAPELPADHAVSPAFSRRSSSIVWSSQFDDVIGSAPTSSSPSSPRHSNSVSRVAERTGSDFLTSKSYLQHLSRTFLYPDDELYWALRRTPPPAFALSRRYLEPVPRPCSTLAHAVPARSSYMSSVTPVSDRRSQTPRVTLKRRSSSRMTVSSVNSSRPSSRRPQQYLSDDLHEEGSDLDPDNDLGPSSQVPTMKRSDETTLYDLRPECPILLPTMSADEEGALSRDTSFLDLVRGLAIPYITVSRSSSPSNNVLDVRTMNEVVGRVRSAKRHLPAGGSTSSAPTNKNSSRNSKTAAAAAALLLTPGGSTNRGTTN